MLVQVIGAHEFLVALRALETLLSRMSPPVPLQFIGPRESLYAMHPVADEGTLAWKENTLELESTLSHLK